MDNREREKRLVQACMEKVREANASLLQLHEGLANAEASEAPHWVGALKGFAQDAVNAVAKVNTAVKTLQKNRKTQDERGV